MSKHFSSKTDFKDPMLLKGRWFIVIFKAMTLLFILSISACGESELLSRYEVTLVPRLDCSQTGASMVQCAETSVLRQNNRKGSWIIEKREDGHLFNPQSSFNITLENGSVLSGIYFADNKNLLEDSEICTGEAEHCFYARSKSTEVDAGLGCQKIIDKSIIFTIEKTVIKGEIIESQITDAQCGTQQSSQRIVTIDGAIAEEVVYAREEN